MSAFDDDEKEHGKDEEEEEEEERRTVSSLAMSSEKNDWEEVYREHTDYVLENCSLKYAIETAVRLRDGTFMYMGSLPEKARVVSGEGGRSYRITEKELSLPAFPEAVTCDEVHRVEICGGMRLGSAHARLAKNATVHEFLWELHTIYANIPHCDRWPAFLEGWYPEKRFDDDVKVYRLRVGS